MLCVTTSGEIIASAKQAEITNEGLALLEVLYSHIQIHSKNSPKNIATDPIKTHIKSITDKIPDETMVKSYYESRLQ